MNKERKQYLLNNMAEYLSNFKSFNFESIGVTENTELDEAYSKCLDYIVELVDHNGDKYFFENILGFTKEELMTEGMEWVYE